MLRLYGIVDSCDANTIYLAGHAESIQKVKSTAKSWNRIPSIKDNKIKIQYNLALGLIPVGAAKKNPSDEGIVGKKVQVWVRIHKYEFTSKSEHNKGELIKGFNLYLTKFEANSDWSN